MTDERFTDPEEAHAEALRIERMRRRPQKMRYAVEEVARGPWSPNYAVVDPEAGAIIALCWEKGVADEIALHFTVEGIYTGAKKPC